MKAIDLKPLAMGRWEEILTALAPQSIVALKHKGRHVPCPVHGGKDGFRVFKNVAITGGTVCNTCGFNNDGFNTIMWLNGWDFKTTLQAVADHLGFGSQENPAIPRASINARNFGHNDEKLRQALNRVWHESLSLYDTEAGPARLYLARRGISILPAEGSARFHPSLAYYDNRKLVSRFPAIVAMVSDAEGRPVTIHRTYITVDGRKAPVHSPRKLMGYPTGERQITGGAIRLTRSDTQTLAIAEGLETALSVIEGTGIPTWCVINATLLETFVPPEEVSRVLVFADKDIGIDQHPKGHGQEAARNLTMRLWREGFITSIFMPSTKIAQGQKSIDWNDVLFKQGKQGFPVVDLEENRFGQKSA
ncbi:MAG TPA: toprim domain-containing protein [Nitrosomonas mobilis]|nr:toprim domain-containing protein [Nitrosomonas mobilis]